MLEQLRESAKYAEINKAAEKGRKPKMYTWELMEAVQARIPPTILNAMSSVGWNVFGVFEVIEDEMRKEKKRKKNGS